MISQFLQLLSFVMAVKCPQAVDLAITVQNSVRLVGGESALEGRVEVFRGDQWGTVCDDSWGDVDASVVCKQLGYSPIGAMAFGKAKFGAGTGPIYFDEVACSGDEERLSDCGNIECGHDEDASVICSEGANFFFGSKLLRNNSFITLSKSNVSILECFIENHLENDPRVVWILPNGSNLQASALNSTLDGLYSYAQKQSLFLSFQSTSNLVYGLYQCVIPSEENKTDSLFIGIINSTENAGRLKIDELHYDTGRNAIFCVSSGGPIMKIVWRKHGQQLGINDPRYEFSQTLVSGTQSVISNTLRFVSKDIEDSGRYSCDISNQDWNVSSTLNISTCKQDSTRLLYKKEFEAKLQVCFNDDWHSTEEINGSIFRKTVESELELHIRPSHDSVQVDLSINSTLGIPNVLVVECQTEQSHSKHGYIFLTATQTNELESITVNGLLQQTQYRCCVKAGRNSTSSIPSISTKCQLVITGQADSKVQVNTIIALGTLLGLIVMVAVMSPICILTVVGVKAFCRKRRRHGSLECSVMRENPLYESANDALGAPEKHIYSDIFLLDDSVDNNQRYIDVHVPLSPMSSDSSTANNPLYARRDSKV